MNKTTEYIVNKMKGTAEAEMDTDFTDSFAQAAKDALIEECENVFEQFCANDLPNILEEYSPDDEVAINEGFNNYKDMLHKNGEISEITVDHLTFDFESWGE